MTELTPSKTIEVYCAALNLAQAVLGKGAVEADVVELASSLVDLALKARSETP